MDSKTDILLRLSINFRFPMLRTQLEASCATRAKALLLMSVRLDGTTGKRFNRDITLCNHFQQGKP